MKCLNQKETKLLLLGFFFMNISFLFLYLEVLQSELKAHRNVPSVSQE